MIRLSNGATVHAAYLLPARPGMKPSGLVLAETATDWVTWAVYWEGDTTGDDEGQTHEQWEAETGHYFQKSMPHSQGDPEDLARFDFGLRLRRHLTYTIQRGIEARGHE